MKLDMVSFGFEEVNMNDAIKQKRKDSVYQTSFVRVNVIYLSYKKLKRLILLI